MVDKARYGNVRTEERIVVCNACGLCYLRVVEDAVVTEPSSLLALSSWCASFQPCRTSCLVACTSWTWLLVGRRRALTLWFSIWLAVGVRVVIRVRLAAFIPTALISTLCTFIPVRAMTSSSRYPLALLGRLVRCCAATARVSKTTANLWLG